MLGVHATRPPLSGEISFQSQIVIPPGDVEVVQKLRLDGAFTVASAQFSELNVQDKVNELSHRGKGNPNNAGAPSVAFDFSGKFLLDEGVLALCDLSFHVPGVVIALSGKYGLQNQSLDFQGTATVDAKLSQTNGLQIRCTESGRSFLPEEGIFCRRRHSYQDFRNQG
uniref:AsmA-like C-terminal domain-containing protein n=1 Tax=uncultured bacterium CSLD10 TaxID=1091573 RepID=G4WVW7_9BACT|nr:hypothetical protein [uncultured bacterium CSLD10]